MPAKRKRLRFTLQAQLLVSYLLVLVIPLLISSIAYRRAYSVVESKELQTHEMLLSNGILEMDGLLRRIDSLLIDINLNGAISKLLALKAQPAKGSQEAALVYQANRVLSGYAASSGLGSDFAIYFSRADLVFCGASIVYGCDRFYNQAVSYQDMDFQAFKRDVLDTYRFRGALGNMMIVDRRAASGSRYIRTQPGALYISSLPLMSGNAGAQGTFVLNLDASAFGQLAASAETGYGLVADAQGNVLAGGIDVGLEKDEIRALAVGRGGTLYKDIGGQKMLITYAKSEYNNWIYLTLSPMEQIMKDLRNLQTTIIIACMAIVLVGTVLAVWLTRRHSRPLEATLMELQKLARSAPDATLKGLASGVSSVMQDNRELQDTLQTQRTMMRVSFFESLLHGDYADPGRASAMIDYLELDLSGRWFCFAQLSPRTRGGGAGALMERDILQIYSERLMRGAEGVRVFTHARAGEELNLILCLDEADPLTCRDVARALMTQFVERIHGSLGVEAACTVGCFVENPQDLSQSYIEAGIAADQMRQMGDAQSVLFYDEIAGQGMGYFYPSEIENKLKNLIEADNAQGASQLLDYLYQENFENRNLSRYLEYCLFMDLHSSLVKINHNQKLSWHLNGLFRLKPETLDTEAEFQRVRDTVDHMLVLHGEKPKEAALIAQIEQFIQANYTSSDMGVALISQTFYISESYFSQYFHQKMGLTFSKYLETLRMNRACELIKQSALNIDEIAAAVGYQSTMSFRRAFKKVIGLTPSQYRQSQ